jgi:hypothetical protein
LSFITTNASELKRRPTFGERREKHRLLDHNLFEYLLR